jgi:DNA-binding winged helix-turn-helix (wHTH) protein
VNACSKGQSQLKVQYTVYLFDGFQLDVTRRKLVSSGGLVQPLNSRAMEALLLLVANAGELVEKRRLMETIWPQAVVEDNNLNQCILAIRKALGEVAGSNRYVMTVQGRGYRFVSPVRTVVRESVADHGTTDTTALRRPPLWVGIAAGVCALGLIVLLTYLARNPAVELMMASVDVTADGTAEPSTMVLRLHERTDGPLAAEGATSLLADCLSARPEMKLRIQVELVPEEGEKPVWTGHYVAGAQDLLALREHDDVAALGCRELSAALAAN